MKIVYHVARFVLAGLLLMTLRHKFGGTEESVQLFTQLGSHPIGNLLSLGGEPTGRYLVGVLELITGVLLIIPSTVWFGALLACGLMIGAIILHATVLGIDPLFYMALVAFLLSVFLIFWKKK